MLTDQQVKLDAAKLSIQIDIHLGLDVSPTEIANALEDMAPGHDRIVTTRDGNDEITIVMLATGRDYLICETAYYVQ